MKADTGIWNTLTLMVAGLLALALVVGIGSAYIPLIQQNERMRREIYRLDAELQKQEALSQQLHAQIDALRNDPGTVERLAREKLGYAKADETVIHFESVTNGAVTR